MLATPAAAQDYTRGTLVGTVVDDKGAPISGAQVTVTSNEQGHASTVTTDSNGTFRVPALATGPYTVVMRSNNAVIVEDRGANVLAGQSNTFKYTAGGASTAAAVGADQNPDNGLVIVTGQRTQVNDFASTQTGATLDVAELAQTVPVSRSQTALILLAPGTVSGDAGFGDLASIGGATIAENAYYVNGLKITDFRTFVGGSLVPFEFYRTLDVKTGGYQAEYGRALGGVTSAVTKSGSNELQLGAVVTYGPNGLRSNSPDTYLAYNESNYRESIDGNFYLSGPIIKDRLFIYGLYSPRFFKNEDSSFSTQQRVISTADTPFYGLKIDGIIAEGHRVEGTFFRDAQDQTTDFYRFDGTTLEEGALIGTTKSKVGGNNFIGTYTGKFTDFLTLSAAYGVNKSIATSEPSPNVAFISSQINPPTGQTARVVQGFSATQFADRDERKVYRADADVYVKLLGDHHFRAGFDYEKFSASEGTFRSGGGYDYVFARPSAARPNGFIQRTLYRNEGQFRTNQRAFYLQDSYSFNDRLNFQLGVRNDRFENFSVEGDKYYESKSFWAPRLGVSFDVFGDKRTKINAFYGRYYLPIATNTNIRLGGAELFYRQRFNYPAGQGPGTDLNRDGIPDGLTFDAKGDVTNLGTAFGSATCPAASPNAGQTCFSILSDGVQGPTDTLVSSNLKPSLTDEFILGASHRFGSWTVGVDYVRRRLKEALEDVAIDAAVLAYCDANKVAGCGDVFTDFHQYVLANPGSDINVRLDGDCSIAGQCDVATLKAADLGYPKAVRKYDAVQLTVDKAFNGFYGFNASYVWTKLRGNFEGAVKSDNNQTDAGLTQDFDQPGLVDGSDGELANGRRHTFKIYGHVKPVEWLDIGVNARLESPRKFSCIGNYFDEDNFAAAYGSVSYYCTIPTLGDTAVQNSAGGTSYLVNRGEGLKSDWLKNVDLGVALDLSTFSESLGSGFGNSQIRVDVFNVFNFKSKLDRQEFGDRANFVYEPNPNFGRTTGYQAPRSVRLQLAFRFGQR